MIARLAAALLALGVAASCGVGSSAPPSPPADLAGEALARGIAAHNAGKTDEAKQAYYETLYRDPKNKFAFYNLGQIARFANKPQVAEGYYRSAVEIDANFAPALFGLGAVRQTLDATAEAIDLYRRVIAIEPANAAAHYNLGILLRLSGKVVEGDAEIAKGMQLDPKLTAPPPVRPTPTPTR
jgi:tetratricopeptide (TPR) repeat protein